MGERDEKNPVNVYRIPVTESFYQLVLEGATDLTEHEKLMVFMDFISDFYYGADVDARDELSCQSYICFCGGYSNLLAVLACTQNLPARLYTLGNYPTDTGHAVCEIYYNNAWHMY